VSDASTSPRLAVRALGAHSALALATAALVYVLAVTGVIAVFNHELQRWEQPGAPEIDTLPADAAARAARDMLAQETAPTEHLFVQLPTKDLPRAVITTDNGARFVAADGSLAEAEHHPWTQFLLDLHFFLHLPHVVGLTLVGSVGVLLASLAITGLLAHRRIFRDAFKLRLGRHARLTQTDWHNRLGVWTTPFLLSTALTGAMLGLATGAAYGVAALDFEGDVELAFGQVFGAEPTADPRPAPLPDISRALQQMHRDYPDRDPTYVILHAPLTRGQQLQVLADHNERLIFGEYYRFAADGSFIDTVGMADGALGQQIVASAYKLHFGRFGGLAIKLAYAGFGLTLAVIAGSGMRIFFLRRRERGHPLPGLEGAWTALLWGLPGSLAAAQLASLPAIGGDAHLAPIFWSVLLAAMASGWLSSRRQAASPACFAYAVRIVSGILLASASVVHYAVHVDNFTAPAAYGMLGAQFVTAACIALPPLLSIAAPLCRGVRIPARHQTPTRGS